MSSATRSRQKQPENHEIHLVNGERMRQAEFHRKYQAYPDDTKFQLIAGTVYMTSPLKRFHGSYHFLLSWLFGSYSAETQGVQGLDNATTILNDENEPQPALSLRILSELGGRSTLTSEAYVQGPPELVAEIAHSTRALDLHQKKDVYRRAGVLEYVVLAIEQRTVTWFDFRARRQIAPDSAGLCKSRIFPGLWLAIPAFLDQDQKGMGTALRAGLQSPEHTAFVKRMESRPK
ncbi:Uma2 family endonuclease [soil metagenome]